MAKKKLEAFEKASQNYYVVGEVQAASKEEKVSKDGKTNYIQYALRIKTPEKISIFIKKNRYEATESKPEPIFVTECFDTWDEMIEANYEKVRDFVYVSASKKDKKPMYNWFTNYENDEGKISYNIEALPIKLNFTIGEDKGVILNFKNDNSKFIDRKTVIKARMDVTDIVKNTLLLSDGKEEYPNTLTVDLDEGMENKAKIGQGYDFRLKLLKGKKAQVESGTTNWEGDASTNEYEPDKFIIDAVENTIKDMVLAGATTTKKSKKTVVEDDDSAPF